MLRFFYELLTHAGIPRRDSNGRVLDLHAFRHTFATRLARAGVSIHTAKELTGHKTSRMLLDVYTHCDLAQTREAIARLPRLLESDRKCSHA
jgi:integrase